MFSVDVLVIGGGIQGLVMLRHLSDAGYSCLLVTNDEIGGAQTLHSHGLLNSGTGLITGETFRELRDHVHPYLTDLAVPLYGAESSYVSVPPPMMEQLSPLWDAQSYRPEAVAAADVPEGLRLPFPPLRVPALHVPKRALVRALARGYEHRVVQGEVRATGSHYSVSLRQRTEPFELGAHAVVVAAGCGTNRALAELGVQSPFAERLGYVTVHMVCLRSPLGVLPSIGTIITPQLAIIGHVNRDHDSVGDDDLVSWYVSPADPNPQRFHEAAADATAPVDPATVQRAVRLLRQLVPLLEEAHPQIEATVFAGYKQDVDGQMTHRAFDTVDEDRNIFAAVPSVLVNAWPNARDAVERVRRLGAPAAADATLAPSAPPPVGQINELRTACRWEVWKDFAQE